MKPEFHQALYLYISVSQLTRLYKTNPALYLKTHRKIPICITKGTDADLQGLRLFFMIKLSTLIFLCYTVLIEYRKTVYKLLRKGTYFFYKSRCL